MYSPNSTTRRWIVTSAPFSKPQRFTILVGARPFRFVGLPRLPRAAVRHDNAAGDTILRMNSEQRAEDGIAPRPPAKVLVSPKADGRDRPTSGDRPKPHPEIVALLTGASRAIAEPLGRAHFPLRLAAP